MPCYAFHYAAAHLLLTVAVTDDFSLLLLAADFADDYFAMLFACYGCYCYSMSLLSARVDGDILAAFAITPWPPDADMFFCCHCCRHLILLLLMLLPYC